jgi:hypothetical protein
LICTSSARFAVWAFAQLALAAAAVVSAANARREMLGESAWSFMASSLAP